MCSCFPLRQPVSIGRQWPNSSPVWDPVSPRVPPRDPIFFIAHFSPSLDRFREQTVFSIPFSRRDPPPGQVVRPAPVHRQTSPRAHLWDSVIGAGMPRASMDRKAVHPPRKSGGAHREWSRPFREAAGGLSPPSSRIYGESDRRRLEYVPSHERGRIRTFDRPGVFCRECETARRHKREAHGWSCMN